MLKREERYDAKFWQAKKATLRITGASRGSPRSSREFSPGGNSIPRDSWKDSKIDLPVARRELSPWGVQSIETAGKVQK
jgi:hypothetical protein